MEYPVDKTDARAFVGVLVRKFYMDLPKAALERSCFFLAKLFQHGAYSHLVP